MAPAQEGAGAGDGLPFAEGQRGMLDAPGGGTVAMAETDLDIQPVEQLGAGGPGLGDQAGQITHAVKRGEGGQGMGTALHINEAVARDEESGGA